MKNLLKHLGYSLRRGDLKRIEGAFGSAHSCAGKAGSSCQICDGDTNIQYVCGDGDGDNATLWSTWIATADISAFWNHATNGCTDYNTSGHLVSITTCQWTTP
ncbi:MAG: hypothetical protein QM528_06640 [Phycisphaerales bacterium]|nr:hypothetical protein [Phycisphaerales bacterium]